MQNGEIKLNCTFKIPDLKYVLLALLCLLKRIMKKHTTWATSWATTLQQHYIEANGATLEQFKHVKTNLGTFKLKTSPIFAMGPWI